MSLWVVVGGQFGSEGKGKISAVIAVRNDIDLAIRCGGPNSGHSFRRKDGSTALLRELPTAFVNRRTRLLIPAGAVVDLEILRDEIETLEIDPRRVGVDRNAMIISPADLAAETGLLLRERLSSTLSGVGAATARRVMRASDVRLASDAVNSQPWLGDLITNVAAEANSMLDKGGKVLVEGTQGFGLSLFHSEYYPKTTSKDTTAAAFLSEVGVSPLRVTEVILVLRTYPIRVSGLQAGPLLDEVSWEDVQRESGSPYPIVEYTTVTKTKRRVGRFDWGLVRNAVDINRPTQIAINCVDHLDFRNHAVKLPNELTVRAKNFLSRLEVELGTRIGFIGTGQTLDDVMICDRSFSSQQSPPHSKLAS